MRIAMQQDLEKQKRILKLVERIWKKVPTLRFTQLILNCFDEDPYHIGDELTEQRLRAVYKEYL